MVRTSTQRPIEVCSRPIFFKITNRWSLVAACNATYIKDQHKACWPSVSTMWLCRICGLGHDIAVLQRYKECLESALSQAEISNSHEQTLALMSYIAEWLLQRTSNPCAKFTNKATTDGFSYFHFVSWIRKIFNCVWSRDMPPFQWAACTEIDRYTNNTVTIMVKWNWKRFPSAVITQTSENATTYFIVESVKFWLVTVERVNITLY